MRDGHVRKRFDWQPWVYPQCQINYHVGQLSSKAPSSAASSGEPQETGSPSVDGSDPPETGLLAEPRSPTLSPSGVADGPSGPGRVGTPWRDVACKSLPGKSIAEDPAAYLGGGAGAFGGGYSNGAASNASKMLPPSCTSGGAASAAPPPHHSQPTRTFNTTPPPPRLDPLSIGLDHFESDHALALELARRSSAEEPVSEKKPDWESVSTSTRRKKGKGKASSAGGASAAVSAAAAAAAAGAIASGSLAAVPEPKPLSPPSPRAGPKGPVPPTFHFLASSNEEAPLGGAESRSLSDEATSDETAMATVTEDDWAAIAAQAERRPSADEAAAAASHDGDDGALGHARVVMASHSQRKRANAGRPQPAAPYRSTANKGPVELGEKRPRVRPKELSDATRAQIDFLRPAKAPSLLASSPIFDADGGPLGFLSSAIAVGRHHVGRQYGRLLEATPQTRERLALHPTGAGLHAALAMLVAVAMLLVPAGWPALADVFPAWAEIAVGIALVRRPPALTCRSPSLASPASLTVHPPPSSALEVPRSGRDAAGGVHAGADGGGGRPRARRLTPLTLLSLL